MDEDVPAVALPSRQGIDSIPCKQQFYLDYNSHPILLGSASPNNFMWLNHYTILETRVSREFHGNREYYVFKHLVRAIS